MHQLLYWERPMKSDNQRTVFGRDVDADSKSRCMKDSKPKSGDCLQELAGRLDQSLASLLCQFWRDEEQRYQVLRDPEGCIQSLVHPLMSKFAREYDSCGQTGVFRACVDMSFSLRPKIFLLIRRIVEMTKTEATLFDDLSLPNQIVMQVIINYFDLKESEIYLEMMEEMQKQESVAEDETPNSDNKKIVTVSKNKIATVLETQRYLIRRNREKEETNESEFYALMKRCRLQDHLIAAREVDFLARTTNYHYLVEKRLWQKSELERAAQDLDLAFIKNSRIHRTSDGHLNITAWTSGNRTIESEPPIPKEGYLAGEYEDNEPVDVEQEHFEEEEEESELEGEFGSSPSGIGGGGVPLNVTAVPQDTENGTPEPLEGGFYQVSPHLLRDALEKLLADRQRHDWENLMNQDEENYWKMRTKWKQDWYPEDEMNI
ncbi:Cilia- and flagella-associated protein 69 [Orchesella cincta]|uniref:Cilia-and flagella-associated protein 69 n=1 Tax=Orchesella cincta TaxID=48709 RepID=A0A1D2NE57_ORCCI|nr:Cilia- and flagella-associated protein 69 [Orchesella cincta]